MDPGNPYQRLLGDLWDSLAPGVRLAHSLPLEATGTLSIRVANRGFAGMMARAMRLPPAGTAVPTRLTVQVEDKGIRWTRRFDEMIAESLHQIDENGFIEDAGPIKLYFRIESQGEAVAHAHYRTKLFGVPVPRFLGPVVEGRVDGGPDDQSWRVSVQIGHCWFGPICSYEGVMRAQ